MTTLKEITGKVVAMMITGMDEMYMFTNLTQQWTYMVKEMNLPGFTNASPVINVILTPGENNQNNYFVNKPTKRDNGNINGWDKDNKNK